VAQFKSGDFSTCVALRPGRPKTVTTPEIIDQIHEIILEDRRNSPDLAPSDYHLFPGLKKQMKSRHFSSESEVIAAAEIWLDGQYSDFF